MSPVSINWIMVADTSDKQVFHLKISQEENHYLSVRQFSMFFLYMEGTLVKTSLQLLLLKQNTLYTCFSSV